MMPVRTDYLGDVVPALQRLESVSPKTAGVKIDNNDQHPHRYGVKLWNTFGEWSASERTLAESIHVAIDRAEIDGFGFQEKP